LPAQSMSFPTPLVKLDRSRPSSGVRHRWPVQLPHVSTLEPLDPGQFDRISPTRDAASRLRADGSAP
jgi:hypothetical protein